MVSDVARHSRAEDRFEVDSPQWDQTLHELVAEVRATGAAVVCSTHDPLVIEQAHRTTTL